ncbi:unnamed protein product [Heligmosomoides polygyrus]|uniref:39S ribosomal protein L50, mitochondrial n=1 Tax=Heligmosomoides polygyrus TaxID=6339 RepID=A0A3P8BSZ1_HELPZ|nr:unnamed protein product [Heligmosomoides polygyrus]
MRISGVNYVRARSFLKSLFGRSTSAAEDEASSLTKQQQEKLRKILPSVRTDAPKSKIQGDVVSYETGEILDYRIDMDSIRARGFLKYRYNYQPPSGVKETVIAVAKDLLGNNAESVTAFPGSGGKVLGLRNKRLLRQFKPKSDWFDYEDQTFDYTPPEKDMPWDIEIARRMDRHVS